MRFCSEGFSFSQTQPSSAQAARVVQAVDERELRNLDGTSRAMIYPSE